jgi:hypothetical protein
LQEGNCTDCGSSTQREKITLKEHTIFMMTLEMDIHVFYDGNSKSLQLPLRLDLLNDEFQYMKNDSVFAFAEPNSIDKVVMGGEAFIYIDTSISADIGICKN